MNTLREEIHDEIARFVVSSYTQIQFDLFNQYGVALPIEVIEHIKTTPLFQELNLVAHAAEGLLERDPDTVGEVAETCQSLCETLFVNKPVAGITIYEIPNSFWKTTIGDFIYRAHRWAAGEDKPEPYQEASEPS